MSGNENIKPGAASDAEEKMKTENPDTSESAIEIESGADESDLKDKEAEDDVLEGEVESGEEAAEESQGDEGDKKDPRDGKIEELNEKHLRLMAEFENFRKRSEKEKETMFEAGVKNVVEKILPVVDNFERALGMAGSEGTEEDSEKAVDPFMDGMRKIYKQLMQELDSIGVRPIEAVGKEFDPTFHNAVMQEESDSAESGTVLKELQKGYLYRNSVVRHSMVSVAS